MKLILSRKGFDSQYGGIPSPVLPDGTLLSLPIPSGPSGVPYAGLVHDGRTYADIIAELGGKPAAVHGHGHLDPDLRPHGVPGWVPAFGQAGAAQGHLRNQGVGVGDLFVFFGRFRRAEPDGAGRLRYVPHAPVVHAVFGYLQVGRIVQGEAIRGYPWHPHARCDDPNNTLYLASDRLLDTAQPGAGVLPHRDDRVLTAPGHGVSSWRLLDWMREAPMSYHGPDAVRADHFRAASKGQEFVVEAAPAVLAWVRAILADAPEPSAWPHGAAAHHLAALGGPDPDASTGIRRRSPQS